MHKPILSVVATSRNDNHGKNLLYRMQMFVDGFIAQCKKHDLFAELIIVEWNPPPNTLPLAEALRFPQDKGPCIIRIIRVPPEVHLMFAHADKLPLFQMLGKNVGIRRAKGDFVLATNIDILFSDELIKFMKNHLQPGHLYRVDRLDVPEILPQTNSFNEILKFCFQNYFRINGRNGTVTKKKENFSESWITYFRKFQQILKKIQQPQVIKRLYWFLRRNFISFIKHFICFFYPRNSLILHTNACGDFTLLSQESWNQLKGYPEWCMYSWHLDSILVHQAQQHGIKHHCLSLKMPIFHIEHDLGSGYSPEGAHLLFERLKSKGIPSLKDVDLKNIVEQLKKSNNKTIYNGDNWGIADQVFEEVTI